ncbi:MAG TPA: glycosyltransferase family 39 protein [Actinomycetes bacterium]|nr:glycosyltransferase family 39 protein [Actinomycetes bacterium]
MTVRAGLGEVRRAGREGLAPFAAAPVAAVAGVVVAVLAAVSWRYGYHRDELYYLQQSAHLAWGSVDSGPLVIAIARAASSCCQGALPALRLLSALAAGGTVALTALMARELGGGRFAQWFAGLCIAAAGVLFGAGHLLSTTPFDILAWAGILLLALRLLRTGDTRLWLPLGVLVGAALLNKNTVFLLLSGLGVGLLATPRRRLLWSPWVVAGAFVAAAMWAPSLAWHADHGWAMFEMSRNLRREHSGLGVAIAFLPLQLLLMNPVTAPVWLSGLVGLWRDPERGRCRPVPVAFVVLALVIAVVIGDRPYFLAPMYTALLAAGAVAFERRLAEGRARWSRRAASGVLVIGGLAALPVALPVLPASALRTMPLQHVNYDLGEQIGWQELSRTVVAAYRSLGRSDAVVVGSNYGEAGALARYGPPGIAGQAYSRQNTDWWYGPPPDDARSAVLIGFGRELVDRLWTDCRRFDRVGNAAGVDNDEEGRPVWVCTGQRSPWSSTWPELRAYG